MAETDQTSRPGTQKEQGTMSDVRKPGESIPIASLLNPRDLGGWATRVA
jgi:hypothetical protein